jgi:uncharacterized RDD family membrane protein YckC
MEPVVYYRPEDYAGFWRRLAVDLADLLVLTFLCAFLALLLWIALPSGASLGYTIVVTCAATAFVYMALLKRSKFGTFGYRIGGVRLVGLDGATASLSASTVRFLFAALFPINWVLDLIWLANEPHRQEAEDPSPAPRRLH